MDSRFVAAWRKLDEGRAAGRPFDRALASADASTLVATLAGAAADLSSSGGTRGAAGAFQNA